MMDPSYTPKRDEEVAAFSLMTLSAPLPSSTTTTTTTTTTTQRNQQHAGVTPLRFQMYSH